jgi:hypothetical protein
MDGACAEPSGWMHSSQPPPGVCRLRRLRRAPGSPPDRHGQPSLKTARTVVPRTALGTSPNVALSQHLVLREVRELTMTTWIMQNTGESPAIADEFALRVASLREGDFGRAWNFF